MLILLAVLEVGGCSRSAACSAGIGGLELGLERAGGRAGLAGARSGLWYEYRRVVAELRPGWVVVENAVVPRCAEVIGRLIVELSR